MRRILIRLDLRQSAARATVGGIARYASTHAGWDMQILDGHPANAPVCDFFSWKPDALIIDQPLDVDWVSEFKRNGLKALVSFHREDFHDLGVSVVLAESDHRAIGAAGAELFMRKGLASFGYVPAPTRDVCLDEREDAFRRTLAAKGFSVTTFRRPHGITTNWTDEATALSAWLRELPKPCGVMAAFDQRAKHVLDTCRLSGIAVPEQVQVLGVDNEEMICEQAIPPLSSVMPDFEDLGFRAAAELDRLLRAKQIRKAHILGTVKGVVERLTTSDWRCSARCVAYAREFIRRHAAAQITVADVVRASRTSERLLQRHFRDICGHSVRDELIATRLELVKDRLRTTHVPIDLVGDYCGFRDAKHLKNLFRRRFGVSMSEFRARENHSARNG